MNEHQQIPEQGTEPQPQQQLQQKESELNQLSQQSPVINQQELQNPQELQQVNQDPLTQLIDLSQHQEPQNQDQQPPLIDLNDLQLFEQPQTKNEQSQQANIIKQQDQLPNSQFQTNLPEQQTQSQAPQAQLIDFNEVQDQSLPTESQKAEQNHQQQAECEQSQNQQIDEPQPIQAQELPQLNEQQAEQQYIGSQLEINQQTAETQPNQNQNSQNLIDGESIELPAHQNPQTPQQNQPLNDSHQNLEIQNQNQKNQSQIKQEQNNPPPQQSFEAPKSQWPLVEQLMHQVQLQLQQIQKDLQQELKSKQKQKPDQQQQKPSQQSQKKSSTPSQKENNEESEQTPQQKQSFFSSLFSKLQANKAPSAIYPPNFPPPPIPHKKTLIFDLDETLIHSSDFPPHSLVEAFKSGDPPFYVFKRPGLDDFLKKISQKFDLFIFTFGEKNYANPIIDVILPSLDEQHRLFRDSCVIENDEVHKDISVFKRSLNDIIVIEDNFGMKKFHPNNTIIVPKWNGVPYDKTLFNWLPDILDECAKAKDVRKVINNIKYDKFMCVKTK